MQRKQAQASTALLADAMLFLSGCALLFQDGAFSKVDLFFKLLEEVAEGETYTAYTGAFPAAIRLKKRIVRLSGNLSSDSGDYPDKVAVEATFSDLDTGHTACTSCQSRSGMGRYGRDDLQFFNILNSSDVVWLRSQVLNEGDQFVPSRWETPRRLMVRVGLEY